MSEHDWADESLSDELPVLRARGEGQDLEFKREFPQQASDLAKEIAAFATSNTGTIVLGVADDGDLVGLADVADARRRDRLVRRLEGICSGSVKPAVTPIARWAVESGAAVLVVTVRKGSEPVYYSQGRPYVRHITTSRPAEPQEVVELVRRSLDSRLEPSAPGDDGVSSFYSALAGTLNTVLMWAETPKGERSVNPMLDEWRSDYAYAAAELRDLSLGDVAVRLGIEGRLKELANAIDGVANFRMYAGCGAKLEAAADRAMGLTRALKEDAIDPIPLSAAAIDQVRSLLRENHRRGADLADRAREMVDAGRVKELLAEFGAMGNVLTKLSFHDLSRLGEGMSLRLRRVGSDLRSLSATRIRMDGGLTMDRIVQRAKQCAQELGAIVSDMDSGGAESQDRPPRS